MTTRAGSAITWYSFDKPKKINSGSQSTEFWYGPDRARYRQEQRTSGSLDATIRYVGMLFEYEDYPSATDIYRHFVHSGDRVVAVVERDASGSPSNSKKYLHRDNQRSVTKVTNSSGTVIEALAFDAWGLRRDATDWSPLASPFAGSHATERGYNGHEHLDTVGLIHMNGRVQDPLIGRFISADPYVQAPFSTQSHNRFSYVINNPASLIDPSGFVWEFDPWTGGYGQNFDFRNIDWGATEGAPWDQYFYGHYVDLAFGDCFVCEDPVTVFREMGVAFDEFVVPNGGAVITGQRTESGNETTTYTYGGTEWSVDSQQFATAVDYIRTHIPLQAAQRDGRWKEHYSRLYYSSGPPRDGIPMPGNPDGMCFGSPAACRQADRNPTRANSRALEANAEAAANSLPSMTMNVHLHPGTNANSLRFSDADISLAAGIPVFIGNMGGDIAVLLPGMSPSRRGDGLVLCEGCAK
jgi:RHS repeat-associated protein